MKQVQSLVGVIFSSFSRIKYLFLINKVNVLLERVWKSVHNINISQLVTGTIYVSWLRLHSFRTPYMHKWYNKKQLQAGKHFLYIFKVPNGDSMARSLHCVIF